MELLLFGGVFLLCNLFLWLWSKKLLRGFDLENVVLFIRGTVRGCLGRFESNSSLEERRARLNKKKSKI